MIILLKKFVSPFKKEQAAQNFKKKVNSARYCYRHVGQLALQYELEF